MARKLKWPTDVERWLERERKRGPTWGSQKLAARHQRNHEAAVAKFERDKKRVDKELREFAEGYKQEQQARMLLAIGDGLDDVFSEPRNVNYVEEYKRLRQESRDWEHIKETSRPPRSILWGRKRGVFVEPIKQEDGPWRRFVQAIRKVWRKPISTECQETPDATDMVELQGPVHTEVRKTNPFVREQKAKKKKS